MDVLSGWIGSVTKRKEEVKNDADEESAKPDQNNPEAGDVNVQSAHDDGDASTPTSTGSGSITSGPDSEPASTPESEGPDPENKAAAIAEELENVSNKAIQSAKTFGSFLFSVANKAGKTVSETAKQIKHTVEENTILNDFNKEQENFSKEVKADGSGNAVPPWVGYNEEDAMKAQILSLSSDKRNFLRSPPSGVQFTFDFDSYYPVALATLNEDPNLQKMRFDLVPKSVNEETFWRNYFYRVSLIKQSTQLTSLAQETGSTGDSSTKSSRRNSRDESGQKKRIGHVNDSELAQDSPNQEFVSDSYSQNIDMEDIKKGMKQLGVTSTNSQPTNDEEWEKELQQELQEYEVVNQEGGATNVDDPEWEKEMEQMLSQQSAQ